MCRDSFRFHFVFLLILAGIFFACAPDLSALSSASDDKAVVFSDQEKPIFERMCGIYKLPDGVRSDTTKELALQIRRLPVTANKPLLADALATVSNRGSTPTMTLCKRS